MNGYFIQHRGNTSNSKRNVSESSDVNVGNMMQSVVLDGNPLNEDEDM